MRKEYNFGTLTADSSKVFKVCIFLGVLILFCGCAAPSIKKDKDLTSLLENYKKQNTQLKELRQKQLEHSIKKLEVIKSDVSADLLVSIDIKNADASTVINSLIEKTGVQYILEGVVIRGTISARFDRIPLVQAVNLLLNPLGVYCVLKDNIYIFTNNLPDAAKPPAASDTAKPTINTELPLKYIKAEAAARLLEGIYPPTTTVTFGKLPNTNTIFLRGPSDEIEKAVKLLKKADRDPSHVMIEALIVECDSDALEKIGIDISKASSGRYSDASFSLGSLTNRSIIFTNTAGANNLKIFTAAIDLLVSQDKARIISRPYISTLSGEKASINITRDRYVITQTTQDGAAVSTMKPVSSGVMLDITPIVSSDGLIRVEINVEDSEFIPTGGNIAVEVDKNKAATIMHVESGKAIIIGGLVLNRESSSNAGLPWLRRVPILNTLFAKQENIVSKQEVLIFITPYIWTPDMSTPMINPEAFTIKEDDETFTKFEKLGIE